MMGAASQVYKQSCPLRKPRRKNHIAYKDGSGFPIVSMMRRCTVGGSVKMVGTLQDSPGSKQAKELRVTKLELLGSCDAVSL